MYFGRYRDLATKTNLVVRDSLKYSNSETPVHSNARNSMKLKLSSDLFNNVPILYCEMQVVGI